MTRFETDLKGLNGAFWKKMDEFLQRYRETRHEITQEELYEMRAAFGPGEEIVDILSGECIQL